MRSLSERPARVGERAGAFGGLPQDGGGVEAGAEVRRRPADGLTNASRIRTVRFTHAIVFVVTNIVAAFLFSSLLRAFGVS